MKITIAASTPLPKLLADLALEFDRRANQARFLENNAKTKREMTIADAMRSAYLSSAHFIRSISVEGQG